MTNAKSTIGAGDARGIRLAPPPIAEARLFVRGRVEHGDQRGRQIGFPTANIAVDLHTIAPPDGVYAGYVYLGDRRTMQAAISVGRRPTFYEEQGLRLMEAHLLNFAGDLYGQVILVELASKLRDQVKFAGIDELRTQLASDVDRCTEVLSAVPASGTG